MWRTLGTRDKLEAQRRLPAKLAAIQREVEEAIAGRHQLDPKCSASVLQELHNIEARHRAGAYPAPEHPADVAGAEFELGELLHAHAVSIGAVDPEDGPALNLLSPPVSARFTQVHRSITDPGYRPLSDWATDFIKGKQERGLKKGTWKDHENRLAEFARQVGARVHPRFHGHLREGRSRP